MDTLNIVIEKVVLMKNNIIVLNGSTEPPVGHTETLTWCVGNSHNIPLQLMTGKLKEWSRRKREDDFWFNADFSKLLTMYFANLVLHIIPAI